MRSVVISCFSKGDALNETVMWLEFVEISPWPRSKRVIDMMDIYKMNRFQWHLTEDQGWRIEIKKYPKLTETGAWRNSKVLAYGDVKPDGERYGGFYTQKDIKEIVTNAKKKFI